MSWVFYFSNQRNLLHFWILSNKQLKILSYEKATIFIIH